VTVELEEDPIGHEDSFNKDRPISSLEYFKQANGP